MKGFGKALFKAAVVESFTGKKVVVRMPPNTPMQRAEEQKKALIEAMARVCGATYAVDLVAGDPTAPGGIARPRTTAPDDSVGDVTGGSSRDAAPAAPESEEIPDISEFTEIAPENPHQEGLLKEMFPGANEVDEPGAAPARKK